MISLGSCHSPPSLGVLNSPSLASCTMGIAILCSLAVLAVLHIPGSLGTGACPTLFNFYSHPTDCSKFYRCFWGAPIEFSCPAGTHWNQQILTCDHAYNVPCASAILRPIYKLIGNDGYGYVNRGYVRDGYATKGYEKGNYAGYDSTGNRYGGAYVKANDYGNYGGFFGTSGYTRQTYPPTLGHNYGGFGARTGYGHGAYVRSNYAHYPAYGGYVAGGYGLGDGYASRAASGYAGVGDPIVGRVFGKASRGAQKHSSWKK